MSDITDSGVEDFRARVLGAHGWPSEQLLDDRIVALRETAQHREPELKQAAVLVSVVERAGRPHMVMTQRTLSLRSHSGQVAFPGGKIDSGDGSPQAAALREAYEEIGVPPQAFEILGRMPDYITATGYVIAPVLAVAEPGIQYRVNPAEVAAAFEVPLDFLMDPRNHRQESGVWRGVDIRYWSMPYGNRYIWGVTARIIRSIYERLYA